MNTATPSASSLQTRASLLARIRNWDDAASWQEFNRLYRRVIYGVARRSGLTHPEAEDVAQDVFQHVAQRIHEFECRSHRGSFRRWLLNHTRWRITDRFRERCRIDAAGNLFVALDCDDVQAPSTPPGEGEWEKQWQEDLLATALDRLASRVPAKQFQAFDLSLRQRWPARRIAEHLGINVASVYIYNHRLTRSLRKEVARIRKHFE